MTKTVRKDSLFNQALQGWALDLVRKRASVHKNKLFNKALASSWPRVDPSWPVLAPHEPAIFNAFQNAGAVGLMLAYLTLFPAKPLSRHTPDKPLNRGGGALNPATQGGHAEARCYLHFLQQEAC